MHIRPASRSKHFNRLLIRPPRSWSPGLAVNCERKELRRPKQLCQSTRRNEKTGHSSRSIRSSNTSRQRHVIESVKRLQFLLADASLRSSQTRVDCDWQLKALSDAQHYNQQALNLAEFAPTSRAMYLQAADIATSYENPRAAAKYRHAAEMAPCEDFNSRVMLALSHIHKSEYELAKSLLERLSKESSRDYLTWLLLGTCHEGLAEYSEAEACYSGCIALWPDNYIGFLLRSTARIQGQRYHEAIADLDEVLETHPDLAVAWTNRAIANLALKRFEDALRDSTRAIDSGALDASTYFLRSRVHRQLGQIEQAGTDLQSAMQTPPMSALDWTQRSLVTRLADPEAALEELNRALEINPRSKKALQNKAALLSLLERNEAAIEVLTQMIKLPNAPSAVYRARGLLRAKLGDRTGALADARVGMDPSHAPTSHYQLARIYATTSQSFDDHDMRLAAGHLEQALKAAPNIAELLDADPDLRAVLDLPEVRSMLLTAKSLLGE